MMVATPNKLDKGSLKHNTLGMNHPSIGLSYEKFLQRRLVHFFNHAKIDSVLNVRVSLSDACRLTLRALRISFLDVTDIQKGSSGNQRN